jgi:hypothetical protein
MTEIIGQGERILLKILQDLFYGEEILTQVPLKKLLTKEYQEDMGERALKETLDLVVMKKTPLVVRVQDDRHKTKAFGIIDERQRTELEKSGCSVIDVFKYECPEIFKEKNYDKAYLEFRLLLR